MNGPDRLPWRSLLQAGLLAAPAGAVARDDPNRPLLASLLAGQAAGEGCLPADLGLGAERHAALLRDYFPGCPLSPAASSRLDLPEAEELQRLLRDHLAPGLPSAAWMLDILTAACVGRDHLWQDLGLNDRAELSRLMLINFPALAAANTGDMKWKKFLYRQFCAREGIYVCPAPSCGVCADHAKCFGPEN